MGYRRNFAASLLLTFALTGCRTSGSPATEPSTIKTTTLRALSDAPSSLEGMYSIHDPKTGVTIPFLRVYRNADGTFRSDGYEHGAWKTAPVVGRPLTKEEFVKLVGAGFDVPFTGLVFGQTVLAKLPPGFTRGKFKTETGYVFYTVLGPIELEKS